MRISDWSSDVCSSDLGQAKPAARFRPVRLTPELLRGSVRRHPAQRLLSELSQPLSVRERSRDRRLLHARRSEEHTSELQSLMRISYAVFCLKKKKQRTKINYKKD